MRKSQKQTAGIFIFVKQECANYVAGSCLFLKNDCHVLSGRRCGYFEIAVLGPPDYPYRLPNYDYSKLFAEYADLTDTQTKKVKQRRCECGSPLQYREKVCQSCRERKRRESYRNYRDSKRLMRHS